MKQTRNRSLPANTTDLLCRAVFPETPEDFKGLTAFLKLSANFKTYISRASSISIAMRVIEPSKGRISQAILNVLDRFAEFILYNTDARACIFSGNLHGVQEIIDLLRALPEEQSRGAAELIAKAMALAFTPPYPMKIGAKTFFFGKRSHIVGVLNVTPDSFSDGGRHNEPKAAVKRALEMEEQGADIIDIGGESTRPGSKEVSAKEEIRRVLPVIEALKGKLKAPISIDTTKSEVALEAVKAGAQMINDTSCLRNDKKIAHIAAEFDVPLCIMHSRHSPSEMQQKVSFTDAVSEIIDELGQAIELAEKEGLSEAQIIVDPGIGFGKKLEHNLSIIRRLREFSALGRPILVGPSRKSFIGEAAGAKVEKRLAGTIAAVSSCALDGANFIRVHDVFEAKQAATLCERIRGEQPDG